ncbi:MAG TPA: hypothetical protein VII16_13120 [Actinomycetes bacterium]|jgi:hypothetical protein
MPPVPVRSPLADQAAALEPEERSLRTALANLSGFAARAALVRLGRVQDHHDNTLRPALRSCLELGPLADRLFPGELLVMDGTC